MAVVALMPSGYWINACIQNVLSPQRTICLVVSMDNAGGLRVISLLGGWQPGWTLTSSGQLGMFTKRGKTLRIFVKACSPWKTLDTVLYLSYFSGFSNQTAIKLKNLGYCLYPSAQGVAESTSNYQCARAQEYLMLRVLLKDCNLLDVAIWGEDCVKCVHSDRISHVLDLHNQSYQHQLKADCIAIVLAQPVKALTQCEEERHTQAMFPSSHSSAIIILTHEVDFMCKQMLVKESSKGELPVPAAHCSLRGLQCWWGPVDSGWGH